MRRRKNPIRIIVIVICALIFSFSMYKFLTIMMDYKKDSDTYEEIRNNVRETRARRTTEALTEPTEDSDHDPDEPTQAPKQEPVIPEDILAGIETHEHKKSLSFLHTTFDYILVQRYDIDFAYLQNMNSEIKAWIRIDDTRIDYPVAQTKNNSKYLRVGPDGKAANAGTIFIDYRNAADFSNKNTVLYGHNQQSLHMFHQLLSYLDQSFLKTHPVIDIYLPDGSMKRYLVFASYVNSELFPYTTSFADDNAFQEFLNKSQAASVWDTNVNLTTSDRILTLVTCTKDYNDAERNVVQAVLIHEE